MTRGRKPKITSEDINQLNSNEYFTIDELSKILKVNRRTIERLIKSNKINYIKIGNQYRIKKEDFIKKEEDKK